MSEFLGYALGYDAGRSDAESSRQTREIADRFIYGQRLVQVDQSYIDRVRSVAGHNYNKGAEYQSNAVYWTAKAEQFHGEALYWRGRALTAEADAKALRDQLAERDSALDQTHKAYAAERAVHQTTHQEKCSLL